MNGKKFIDSAIVRYFSFINNHFRKSTSLNNVNPITNIRK